MKKAIQLTFLMAMGLFVAFCSSESKPGNGGSDNGGGGDNLKPGELGLTSKDLLLTAAIDAKSVPTDVAALDSNNADAWTAGSIVGDLTTSASPAGITDTLSIGLIAMELVGIDADQDLNIEVTATAVKPNNTVAATQTAKYVMGSTKKSFDIQSADFSDVFKEENAGSTIKLSMSYVPTIADFKYKDGKTYTKVTIQDIAPITFMIPAPVTFTSANLKLAASASAPQGTAVQPLGAQEVSFDSNDWKKGFIIGTKDTPLEVGDLTNIVIKYIIKEDLAKIGLDKNNLSKINATLMTGTNEQAAIIKNFEGNNYFNMTASDFSSEIKSGAITRFTFKYDTQLPIRDVKTGNYISSVTVEDLMPITIFFNN